MCTFKAESPTCPTSFLSDFISQLTLFDLALQLLLMAIWSLPYFQLTSERTPRGRNGAGNITGSDKPHILWRDKSVCLWIQRGSRISCFLIGEGLGLKCRLLNEIIMRKWERDHERLKTDGFLLPNLFLPCTMKSLAGSDINLYTQWYEVPGVKLLHHLTSVKSLFDGIIQAFLLNIFSLSDFSFYNLY